MFCFPQTEMNSVLCSSSSSSSSTINVFSIYQEGKVMEKKVWILLLKSKSLAPSLTKSLISLCVLW